MTNYFIKPLSDSTTPTLVAAIRYIFGAIICAELTVFGMLGLCSPILLVIYISGPHQPLGLGPVGLIGLALALVAFGTICGISCISIGRWARLWS